MGRIVSCSLTDETYNRAKAHNISMSEALRVGILTMLKMEAEHKPETDSKLYRLSQMYKKEMLILQGKVEEMRHELASK